ncbi:HET domain protein [Pochonia chlamydosporia 170]|uniref:HET domain protein n=1 Tax=Pochonia chlamydosporia 170 TaxID=1380566 RepID=A0A219ARF8_METCM|nr:HET domain protein [Pochonia chlamydosporia 170]OWT43367.1 HET domain protein [Pochonia chlamydosporia 170]
MWLINTTDLSIQFFQGETTPAYAILSHTWEADEVSFQEFRQLSDDRHSPHDKILRKQGYRKIAAACNRARKDGHLYVWVDTCCIDKTSSAELTEAINSMFRWYKESQVCYAYLSDVTVDAEELASSSQKLEECLSQCRWFTRGWCLQELLAPQKIRFFNRQWQEFATKNTLSMYISKLTAIPESVLVTPPRCDIHDFPIARRISWIAKRQTTRVEDMSYSLLGILDINMPMLYGEGHMAFRRLQEEIIRKYNDMSIFAWTEEPTASPYMRVLAPSPSCFRAGPIRDDNARNDSVSQLGDRLRTQFSITNQGVYFPNATIYSQNAVRGHRYHYVMILNYRDPSFRGIIDKDWYIVLQKVGPGLFVRLRDTIDRLKAFRGRPLHDPCHEPVCIINNLSDSMTKQLSMWERHAVRLRWKPWEKSGRKYWHIRATEPRANWDLIGGQFLVEMASERYMHIEFVPGNYKSNPNFEYFVLVIQVGDDGGRDPSRISVRIVDSKIWPGVNATPFQFASKEALALQAIPPKEMGDSRPEWISMVGYEMTVSVQQVNQWNDVPYHLVHIDWRESKPDRRSSRPMPM